MNIDTATSLDDPLSILHHPTLLYWSGCPEPSHGPTCFSASGVNSTLAAWYISRAMVSIFSCMCSVQWGARASAMCASCVPPAMP